MIGQKLKATKDGMNPVSRKHNDALFTIAPVNVNAVILVFLGLIPFWSYHKIKTFYYLRQLNKINPSKKKICLSKGIQCCKDPKRCMTGTLSQPETMLDVSFCFIFGCLNVYWCQNHQNGTNGPNRSRDVI